MTIGERIKAKRIERKMTLLELANKIGVREATAQRYESGNIKNLKQETIVAIANALDTTPSYLMGWDGNTNKKNLRSIARLESSDISQDEDEEISNFISYLISKRGK